MSNSQPTSKDLSRRLSEAGSTGLDLSPGDPLAVEALEAIKEFVRMQHEIASLLGVDADTDSIDLHQRIYGEVSRRASNEPPAVLGAGCGVSPMPTAVEAIEAHVRQIEILCDAANVDPAQWLVSSDEPASPQPPPCEHPFARLGIDADGVMWCIACLKKPLVIPPPFGDSTPLPPDEWQPIETAPRDGKSFLIYCSGRRNTFIVYRKEAFYGDAFMLFGASEHQLDNDPPTHWRPLPASPSTKGEG